LADAAEVLEAAEHALEGRASNSQPNLQQLPKRQPIKGLARKA